MVNIILFVLIKRIVGFF